jgi:uncharacterized protein YbaA (DUF1428 family)
MYLSIYLYPVPATNADGFLRVMRDARRIYLEHGASDVEILAGADVQPAYGCSGVATALGTQPGETIFFSIDRFRDRAHRDETMTRVDADQRIQDLYAELSKFVRIERVVRGEFQSPP